MRVDIKTNFKVKDIDIKAVLLIREALRISSSSSMAKANVEFAIRQHIRELEPELLS